MTATADGKDSAVYTTNDRDHLTLIVAYEQGELGSCEALYLFGSLVRTGLAWSLQGSYGRTARQLLDVGWLSSDGEVNPAIANMLCDHAGCRQTGSHFHAPPGPTLPTYRQAVEQEGGPQ